MKLHDTGVYLVNGVPQTSAPAGVTEADAKKGTIAYGILKAHNTGDSMQDLRMKFDSMTSHDITYVGIIQTARASGMTEFPLPYVMTPTPATAPSARWPSARAAASWPSSSWAAPTI